MLVSHNALQHGYIWHAPLHGGLYSALKQALVSEVNAIDTGFQLLLQKAFTSTRPY